MAGGGGAPFLRRGAGDGHGGSAPAAGVPGRGHPPLRTRRDVTARGAPVPCSRKFGGGRGVSARRRVAGGAGARRESRVGGPARCGEERTTMLDGDLPHAACQASSRAAGPKATSERPPFRPASYCPCFPRCVWGAGWSIWKECFHRYLTAGKCVCSRTVHVAGSGVIQPLPMPPSAWAPASLSETPGWYLGTREWTRPVWMGCIRMAFALPLNRPTSLGVLGCSSVCCSSLF